MRRTLSRMLEVLATLQMREMMETLWVQDTLAKSPKADISDWISSSIRSRSQILLHSIPKRVTSGAVYSSQMGIDSKRARCD